MKRLKALNYMVSQGRFELQTFPLRDAPINLLRGGGKS